MGYGFVGCSAFDPYKQCNEALETGDQLIFTVTETNNIDKEEGNCSSVVPFGVGTTFRLSVDDFVGGEACNSASGKVTIDGGPVLEWIGVGGGAKHNAYFRGDYEFKLDDCAHSCHLEFQENSVRYYNCSSQCEFSNCSGSYLGSWDEE